MLHAVQQFNQADAVPAPLISSVRAHVMTLPTESAMRRFMLNEVFVSSWNASVQHASLYKPDASNDAKGELRQTIYMFLKSVVMPSYARRCTEEEHLKNIELLVAVGNQNGAAILLSDGYKYGVAQKLVNLFLKYLWCMGSIVEPPHCPVDRIILAKTTLRDRFNWTQIVCRAQYMTAIDAMRQEAQAHNQSLSVWELLNYEP